MGLELGWVSWVWRAGLGKLGLDMGLVGQGGVYLLEAGPGRGP